MTKRNRSLKGWNLLLIFIIFLTACQTQNEKVNEDVAVVLPTEEIIVEPTAIPATATSTPEPIDECLSCHLDKERLIETAKIEEVLEAEDSGEG